jgi:erythromycin esterase-like protein
MEGKRFRSSNTLMPFLRHGAPLVLALLSISALGAGEHRASREPRIRSETDAVVHDLCGKRVALLGESPLHGLGRTLEFKVTLVRRLVDECHYSAFFNESGTYDFLNIQKKLESGRQITQPMLAAAIGGLWAVREVEPMIPFLVEKANAGAVFLGGLDDQLQSGTYAQREMPADLVQYLQGDVRKDCLHTLERHTLWQYTSDSPYGPKDKALILGCVDRIEAAASASRSADTTYDLAMLRSLRHSVAADFAPDIPGVDPKIQGFNDRDRSMYRNFQWLMSRLPADSKVIVWAATVHAAKDLSGIPGEQAMVSLGSYIHREFNTRAFALGCSAYSGTYIVFPARQTVRQWSVAPETSLEGQAFAAGSSDARYLNSAQLRKFGPIAARPLSSDFRTARWDEVLDGIVILRDERPPKFSRP